MFCNSSRIWCILAHQIIYFFFHVLSSSVLFIYILVIVIFRSSICAFHPAAIRTRKRKPHTRFSRKKSRNISLCNFCLHTLHVSELHSAITLCSGLCTVLRDFTVARSSAYVLFYYVYFTSGASFL